MRLSKLTGFLSGLGATVVVGIGSIIPPTVSAKPQVTEQDVLPHNQSQPPGAEALDVKALEQSVSNVAVPSPAVQENPTGITAEHLENQREDLAANPLCSLASDVVEARPELQDDGSATQAVAGFPGLVIGVFQRFMRMMGLDRLVQAQSIPKTEIAVVAKPLTASQVVKTGDGVLSGANAQLIGHGSTAPNAAAIAEHELWVKGHLIAKLSSQREANLLAERLSRLVDTASFKAAAIAPTLYQDQPAIAMGDQILFIVDKNITNEDIKNHEILAIRWANNLRLAFGIPALDLTTAQTKMYGIEETEQSIEGLASWYGPYFHGRLTANGETYDQYAFTAAHPSMPLDTYLKITNLNNEKSVIIRLNDRGPYIQPRSLDLSLGAARCLNSVDTGVIPYKATIMKRQPAIATGAAI